MSTKQLYEKTSEGMKEVSPLVNIEDIYSKLSDTSLEALVSLYNHVKCEWKGSVVDTRRTVPLFLRRSGLFITYNNGTKYVTEFFSAGTDQITTEGWVKDSNWTPVPDEDYISAGVKPGVGSIGYEQLNDNLKQLFREKVNVTNYPDDEDIASVDNMLKLKDREANAANFQSKGYVILRKNLCLVNGVVKNILTQTMINQPNTIYEIRYDFDLNGETIGIPDGCTLKLEGGSLKNGIISSDNLMLYSKAFCLHNIRFKGNCTKSLIGKLDWFVKRYSFNIEDKIDNTENLQQLVNCGLENVYVPSNKYIYITRTIEIYGYVNIFSDNSRYNITRANEYNSIAPCIFTDSVVTMLDYHFCSEFKEVLQIGSIQFYNFKKFTTVTKDTINIPIIKISTETNSLGKDSNIVGCKLDFTIKITERESTLIKGDKTFNAVFPNYTGVKLDANKGNISFVTINGEFSHLFKAFSFTKSADKYITAITINGKTNCAIGNEEESNGVGGCIINGEHQPIGVWDESIPYFSFYSCVLNGFVWDIGLTDEIAKGLRNCDIDYHVSSPRMLDHSIESKNIGNRFPDSVISYKEQNLYFPQAVPENLLNLSMYCGNVIKRLFSNKSGFEYRVDNKSIIDNTDFGYILNQNRLFGEIPYCGDTSLDSINMSDEPVFVANSDFISSSHTICITFILDRKYAKTSNCLIYRLGTYSSDMRLKVSASEESTFETSETDVLMVKDFPSKTTDEFYSITSVLKIKIPSTGKRYQKYEISISNAPSIANRYISLPLIYMPLMKGMYKDKAIFESSKRPKFIEGTHIGESHYDLDLKMPIFFNGSIWVNAEGFSAKYNRERTSVRPAKLTSNDKGFRYYDTELSMYIYWDGEKWRESDGAKIETNRNTVCRCGKFSSRPNGVDIYAGFSFFNTDKNKLIVWDGKKWWNPDGTEATE